MSDEPHLPMDLPPPSPPMALPPHGGTHTGERLPKEKVAEIRKLYAEGSNPHAIAKKVGSTWKVVAALCCPERLHQKATPEQIAEVRRLRDEGADFSDIADEMGLKLRVVVAIAASDSEIVQRLQATRSNRALVFEAVALEATTKTIETRLASGKASVAEMSNAAMIANTMVRDTVGAAPIRVRLEADENVMAAMSLFGGGGAKPLPVKSEVIEAELIPTKTEKKA